MSAAVCGKRVFFEDLHSSPPISKRLKFTQGNSAGRFVSTGPKSGPIYDPSLEAGALLSQLHALFPYMEEQAVEKVLEASNNDLEYAIKSLNLLCLSSSLPPACVEYVDQQHASGAFLGGPCQRQPDGISSTIQSEGGKWVERLVSEMMNATDVNSARQRATSVLEAFEKAVVSRSSVVIEEIQKENVVLKEQNRGLVHDNQILKRAVSIQHERQQDLEGRAQELQQVKQLLAQYQEQVRTLELSNYSLTIHLQQAQEGSSMPGRLHPDVF